MEEERVKSALEIAMERISGMPELTPEEIAEQKKKEYSPVGEALCNKYLQGIVDAKDLTVELNKHKGESGGIVRQAFIGRLCSSIQLDDFETAGKALKGLLELAEDRDDFSEKVRNSWDRLLNDFEGQMGETLRELEGAAIESLKRLGISGSAIRPNLLEHEPAKQGLADLRQSFEPKLEKFRTMLKEKLQNVH